MWDEMKTFYQLHRVDLSVTQDFLSKNWWEKRIVFSLEPRYLRKHH
jgi:hypothetical protein